MAWRPSPTPKYVETDQDFLNPVMNATDERKGRAHAGTLIPMTIVGIHLYIWYKWKVAEFDASKGDQRALKYMSDNYTFSKRNFNEGRWWTLITAGFSHEAFWHLFVNSIGLLSFYTAVTIKMGVVRGLASYLAAIGGGSMAHLYAAGQWSDHDAAKVPSSLSRLDSVRSLLQTAPSRRVIDDSDVPGLGASAGVFGLFTLSTVFAPTLMVQIFFIPFPAWVAWGLLVGVDSYCALSPDGRRKMTELTGIRMGHEAHLGGVGTGLLASVLLTPRFWLRR